MCRNSKSLRITLSRIRKFKNYRTREGRCYFCLWMSFSCSADHIQYLPQDHAQDTPQQHNEHIIWIYLFNIKLTNYLISKLKLSLTLFSLLEEFRRWNVQPSNTIYIFCFHKPSPPSISISIRFPQCE